MSVHVSGAKPGIHERLGRTRVHGRDVSVPVSVVDELAGRLRGLAARLAVAGRLRGGLGVLCVDWATSAGRRPSRAGAPWVGRATSEAAAGVALDERLQRLGEPPQHWPRRASDEGPRLAHDARRHASDGRHVGGSASEVQGLPEVGGRLRQQRREAAAGLGNAPETLEPGMVRQWRTRSREC